MNHVLLDRDGVLNLERDGVAVTSPERWQWIEGSLPALRRLVAAGWRVGVATNQSLVARGVMTPSAVDALHASVFAELTGGIGSLDFLLYCPHAPDDACDCRKPAPGLLLQAIERWRVPAGAILFVGDAPSDRQAARAAAMRFALVRTGKGEHTEAMLAASGELGDLWGGRAFADLAAVVDELLGAIDPHPTKGGS